MKRLDAIYKCRLCGKEYVECSTSGEKSNQRFVMDMMYRAVRQKKPEECIFLAVCRQSSATSPFSIMLCLKTLQAALLHQEFIVIIGSSPFYPCFPTFLIKFRYSSRFFPYFFLKISRKKLSFSYPTLPMISLTERSVSAKNLDAT